MRPFHPLTTTEITSITTTTANGGGNILSDGGSPITAKGLCWSTSENPTIANSKTSDGTGTGVFSSSITGLLPVTTYYVRAYATNAYGTAYGNQVTMTTVVTLATLTTTALSAITSTTATGGGNITSDGGATVTVRGVCWNTTGTPTIANTKTTDGTGSGCFHKCPNLSCSKYNLLCEGIRNKQRRYCVRKSDNHSYFSNLT